jgi:hypothetical protein
VNKVFIAVAACALLAACGPKESTDVAAPVAPATDTAPVAVADEPAAPTGETGDAFERPLPAGFVAPLPYHARYDEQTTSPSGLVGRRTEYEFMQGNAAEAMAAFATAAAAAGFVVDSGPTVDEKGVIRQVFSKPRYGVVFVRAQNLDAKSVKNPEGRGMVVAAWPQDIAAPVAAN